MVSINTEVTMTDNGDDDQWLYGDSNLNIVRVRLNIITFY